MLTKKESIETGENFYLLSKMDIRYKGTAMGGEVTDYTIDKIRKYLYKGSKYLAKVAKLGYLTKETIYNLKGSTFGMMIKISDTGKVALEDDSITPTMLLNEYNTAYKMHYSTERGKEERTIRLTLLYMNGKELDKRLLQELSDKVVKGFRSDHKKEVVSNIILNEFRTLVRIIETQNTQYLTTSPIAQVLLTSSGNLAYQSQSVDLNDLMKSIREQVYQIYLKYDEEVE